MTYWTYLGTLFLELAALSQGFCLVHLSESVCEGLSVAFAFSDVAFSQEPEVHALPRIGSAPTRRRLNNPTNGSDAAPL